MQPFIKWVGGKRQLLKELDKLIPEYERIVEPFVGGGAFFIHKKAKLNLINDINKELIIAYKMIKLKPINLIKKMNEFEKKHSKEFYDELKNKDINLLNIRKLDDKLFIAARFIYLNKAGYNGMYRVNSNGKFNVPFGKKKAVKLFVKENILELSTFFNDSNIEIKNKDFEKIFNLAKQGDLFFIDPPYDYEPKYKGFTSYNESNFSREKQVKLKKCIDNLNEKKIKFILTNHDTEFINKLYKNYNFKKVKTNRMINSNSKKRIKSANEVIIFNF